MAIQTASKYIELDKQREIESVFVREREREKVGFDIYLWATVGLIGFWDLTDWLIDRLNAAENAKQKFWGKMRFSVAVYFECS